MKTLFVLLFLVINLLACDASPASSNCEDANYKHKSEAEIAAMTPAQLIDESVKEQVNHMPVLFDDHGILIGQYVNKYGIELFPLLTEYIKAYDPRTPSRCEETRFFIASATATGIDTGFFRLRGTKEGQLAIQALEGAVKRMQEAGFDKGEFERKNFLDFALLRLEMARGTNGRDEMIRATLKARHKILMTESEYLEFSNFLTSFDPTYPTWSEVGEYGPPTTLKESKKYYEAYLKFKAKKKGDS